MYQFLNRFKIKIIILFYYTMAKKHKKKTYNTPKKQKHIHKNVSVNQFINSMNNNPKCSTCTSILGCHNNKYYCGKCHISFNI